MKPERGSRKGEVNILKIEEIEKYVDRPLWGLQGPRKAKKYMVYPSCGHPPIERRKSYVPKGSTVVCPYCECDEEPQIDGEEAFA